MKRIAVLIAILLAISAAPVQAHHAGIPPNTDNWVVVFNKTNFDWSAQHWRRLKPEGNIANLHNRDDYLFLDCDIFPTWNNCISSLQLSLGNNWCFRVYDNASYSNKLDTFKNIQTGGPKYWSMETLPGYNDRMSSFKWAPWDSDTGTCLFNDGE